MTGEAPRPEDSSKQVSGTAHVQSGVPSSGTPGWGGPSPTRRRLDQQVQAAKSTKIDPSGNINHLNASQRATTHTPTSQQPSAKAGVKVGLSLPKTTPHASGSTPSGFREKLGHLGQGVTGGGHGIPNPVSDKIRSKVEGPEGSVRQGVSQTATAAAQGYATGGVHGAVIKGTGAALKNKKTRGILLTLVAILALLPILLVGSFVTLGGMAAASILSVSSGQQNNAISSEGGAMGTHGADFRKWFENSTNGVYGVINADAATKKNCQMPGSSKKLSFTNTTPDTSGLTEAMLAAYTDTFGKPDANALARMGTYEEFYDQSGTYADFGAKDGAAIREVGDDNQARTEFYLDTSSLSKSQKDELTDQQNFYTGLMTCGSQSSDTSKISAAVTLVQAYVYGQVQSCSTGSATTVSLNGNSNLQKEYNWLIQNMGLTGAQAAGVIGNIKAESGGDPTKAEIGHNFSTSYGWGIVQWTGGRHVKVKNYVISTIGEKYYVSQYSNPPASKALSPTELDTLLSTEMQYLSQELNGAYKSNTLAPLKQASTPSAAADVFVANFERPAQLKKTEAVREALAEALYQQYGSSTPAAGTATTASDQTTPASATVCASSSTPSASDGSDQTITVNGKSVTSNDLIAYARTFIGVPYVWGGTTPAGFDCSGYVQYVFAHFGIKLPRTAAQQGAFGKQISKDQAKVGDLVLWSSSGGPGNAYHVAIYLGNGQIINAPKPGDHVKTEALWGSPYFVHIGS